MIDRTSTDHRSPLLLQGKRTFVISRIIILIVAISFSRCLLLFNAPRIAELRSRFRALFLVFLLQESEGLLTHTRYEVIIQLMRLLMRQWLTKRLIVAELVQDLVLLQLVHILELCGHGFAELVHFLREGFFRFDKHVIKPSFKIVFVGQNVSNSIGNLLLKHVKVALGLKVDAVLLIERVTQSCLVLSMILQHSHDVSLRIDQVFHHFLLVRLESKYLLLPLASRLVHDSFETPVELFSMLELDCHDFIPLVHLRDPVVYFLDLLKESLQCVLLTLLQSRN